MAQKLRRTAQEEIAAVIAWAEQNGHRNISASLRAVLRDLEQRGEGNRVIAFDR